MTLSKAVFSTQSSALQTLPASGLSGGPLGILMLIILCGILDFHGRSDFRAYRNDASPRPKHRPLSQKRKEHPPCFHPVEGEREGFQAAWIVGLSSETETVPHVLLTPLCITFTGFMPPSIPPGRAGNDSTGNRASLMRNLRFSLHLPRAHLAADWQGSGNGWETGEPEEEEGTH